MYERLTKGIVFGDNEEITKRLRRIKNLVDELDLAKEYLKKNISLNSDKEVYGDVSISRITTTTYDFKDVPEWVNQKASLDSIEQKLILSKDVEPKINKSIRVSFKKDDKLQV